MSEFPSREKALGMYAMMYRIRKYEESIYYLFLEGIMPGTIHQSTGEEASAVGMLYDLRKDDWMASTHRPAGHDIAKGIPVRAMMCEMFGAEEGCCGGHGGAMHTGDISVGASPANAIGGGNLPSAAGIGLAYKMQGKDNVEYKLYPDLNHCFVPAIYDDILKASKEYSTERHIGDDVIHDIAAFISGNTEPLST